MPRTTPETSRLANPAERFFEWRGGDGCFRYYDKVKKENVNCKIPFVFILLNQFATIGGYNKKLKTGIYSNEVRDTRVEPFVVKMFNGEKIAEGLYADIKEKVVFKSGHFVTSAYIAYKDGDALKIGNIKFQGCSLGPWFDFVKKCGDDLYKKAVVVKEVKHDDSGEIEFNSPVFSLLDVKQETDDAAGLLQAELKEYHEKYFARTTNARVAEPESQQDHPSEENQEAPEEHQAEEPVEEDSVPF